MVWKRKCCVFCLYNLLYIVHWRSFCDLGESESNVRYCSLLSRPSFSSSSLLLILFFFHLSHLFLLSLFLLVFPRLALFYSPFNLSLFFSLLYNYTPLLLSLFFPLNLLLFSFFFSLSRLECCGFRIYPRISIKILLRIGYGSDLPSIFRIWTDLILNLSDCKYPILSEMNLRVHSSLQ